MILKYRILYISYCSLPIYIVACIFEGMHFQHHILHLAAHRLLHPRGGGLKPCGGSATSDPFTHVAPQHVS